MIYKLKTTKLEHLIAIIEMMGSQMKSFVMTRDEANYTPQLEFESDLALDEITWSIQDLKGCEYVAENVAELSKSEYLNRLLDKLILLGYHCKLNH